MKTELYQGLEERHLPNITAFNWHPVSCGLAVNQVFIHNVYLHSPIHCLMFLIMELKLSVLLNHPFNFIHD